MNVAFVLASASAAPAAPLGGGVLIIVGVLLLIFWLLELLVLMNMTGDQFPWRYDKALWFVIVFFGSALGAFVFWMWQKGQKADVRLAKEARVHAIMRGREQADSQSDE